VRGSPPPCDLEGGEVLGRDLCERGVLRPSEVAPVRSPLAGWRSLLRAYRSGLGDDDRGGGGQREAQELGRKLHGSSPNETACNTAVPDSQERITLNSDARCSHPPFVGRRAEARTQPRKTPVRAPITAGIRW